MAANNKLMVVDESTLKDKIYTIRGQQVMLDFDLAEIYGYTTSAFNQQVARNNEKFEGEDFMFRLTRSELDSFVKSHFVISRNETFYKGQGGGTRKLPYAFTEQGVYMLMTVLRGELAVKQSRALIMMIFGGSTRSLRLNLSLSVERYTIVLSCWTLDVKAKKSISAAPHQKMPGGN